MEKTASGAQLNNSLIESVLASTETQPEKAVITSPSDTLVDLPAGYITSSGEVIKTAEVRELNGMDEEAISKSGSSGRAFATILSRAVVKVGETPATENVLDSLLVGDRDALMLGIYKATFGSEVEIPGYCAGCKDFKLAAADLNRDVTVKILVDPIVDRRFTVHGKKNEFLVTLPDGRAQKELSTAEDKTGPELTTILLNHTVLEINGQPVIGKAQLQNLSIMDRRAISDALNERLPGPQFEDIVIPCPDCSGEVVVPFSLGALFRV
jgi:hypothetical protein